MLYRVVVSLFMASGGIYKRGLTKEEAIEICRNSRCDPYEIWDYEQETDLDYIRDFKIDKIIEEIS
jgi:hypothetical protein